MDRNVEQQFRFSIYFRAKFVFGSQLSLRKKLDSMGCCAGVAYLDENRSWFLVIRHVAKLDFNPPLRPMNVCFNPQLLLNIKIDIHLSLKFITDVII